MGFFLVHVNLILGPVKVQKVIKQRRNNKYYYD